jgi:hypothetical protein
MFFIQNIGLNHVNTHNKRTLAEKETLVRPFSPGSTLEPKLKQFCRRGPKWVREPPPLVLVGITNHDKRGDSQRLPVAMIGVKL